MERRKQEIRIYDDFLDQEDFNKVIKFTSKKQWKIQASQRNKSEQKAGLDFLMLDVSDEEFFKYTIFKKLIKVLDYKYDIERIYFNGQWPGRDGSLHVDNCMTTALLYVSPYHPEWGGFTQIYCSHRQQHIIAPLQNRLICFPGNILHKGYAYSTQSAPMRISLAYKLIQAKKK